MNNLDNQIYHVWRPDLHEAVRQAIRQKRRVVIQSHLPLDDCNFADVTLTGRYVGLTGQLAQFVVEDFDPVYGSAFPPSPECEYTFAALTKLPEGGDAKIEYGGRALIVDQELQRNNLPESLLLKISPPSRLRRLRRHARQACPDDLFLMPGLMLIDQEPINRRRLLALLGHYYRQKNRPKPEIVDISAGGACLRSADSRCHRFLGAEDSYLFFFFSENDGLLNSPTVFMGKKVGILRGDGSAHAGMRIRFMKELLWTGPNEELKWIDIEADGSQTITRMLEEWAKAHPTPEEGSN